MLLQLRVHLAKQRERKRTQRRTLRRQRAHGDAERASTQHREPLEAGQMRAALCTLEHRARHEIEHEPRVCRSTLLSCQWPARGHPRHIHARGVCTCGREREQRGEQRLAARRARHKLCIGIPRRECVTQGRLRMEQRPQRAVRGAERPAVQVEHTRKGRGCRKRVAAARESHEHADKRRPQRRRLLGASSGDRLCVRQQQVCEAARCAERAGAEQRMDEAQCVDVGGAVLQRRLDDWLSEVRLDWRAAAHKDRECARRCARRRCIARVFRVAADEGAEHGRRVRAAWRVPRRLREEPRGHRRRGVRCVSQHGVDGVGHVGACTERDTLRERDSGPRVVCGRERCSCTLDDLSEARVVDGLRLRRTHVERGGNEVAGGAGLCERRRGRRTHVHGARERGREAVAAARRARHICDR